MTRIPTKMTVNFRSEAQRVYAAAAANYETEDRLTEAVGHVIGTAVTSHRELGQRFGTEAAVMQLAAGIALETDAAGGDTDAGVTSEQEIQRVERRSHRRPEQPLVFTLLIDLTKSASCRTGADVALALRMIADYVDDPIQNFRDSNAPDELDRNGAIMDSDNVLVGKWSID